MCSEYNYTQIKVNITKIKSNIEEKIKYILFYLTLGLTQHSKY